MSRKETTSHSHIHAGWLIDGSTDSIQQNVIIHVNKGIIHTITPAAQVCLSNATPSDPEKSCLDLTAHTLLPVLVDCHVHLFMSGTSDIAARKRQLDAGYDELKHVIAAHISQHIASGVGAVRDGGDRQGFSQRYRQEVLNVEDAGPGNCPLTGYADRTALSGLCCKIAGKAWHHAGRYGKLIGRAPDTDETLAEAMQRESCLPGYIRPDHVKIVNSGVNSLLCFGKETLPQFSYEEMSYAVRFAAQQGLKTMVHANGGVPVQIAVEAGCHSIEHGFFMGEDNLARMRDRQTFWVPTAFTMRAYAATLPPSSREAATALRNLDHQRDQIRRARDMGVRIALGTDAGSMGVHHGVAVKEELRILMEAGFSLPEAVCCATRNGADLLEIPEIGLLKPGKPAAWIAVKGSPSLLPGSLCDIQRWDAI
jgi:imidazolonepropionase-like amidohydrolase